MWQERKLPSDPDAVSEYEYELFDGASIILTSMGPRTIPAVPPVDLPQFKVSMSVRETKDSGRFVRHIAFVKADSLDDAKSKAIYEAIHYASACSAFWTLVLGRVTNAQK